MKQWYNQVVSITAAGAAEDSHLTSVIPCGIYAQSGA